MLNIAHTLDFAWYSDVVLAVHRYLSFVQGIVDSDTLPLQVSRESLQQHAALKTMKKKLVRKALDMIKKLADAETSFEGEDADSTASAQMLLRLLVCCLRHGCATKAAVSAIT